MLVDHPVDVMLLATDLGVARRFYVGTLGLEVLLEAEQFLTFRCGGTAGWSSPRARPGPPTRRPRPPGAWTTSPAKSPSSGRGGGVQIEDLSELNTVDGFADIGFALAAWFTDPHKNSIGLLQFK